ncbi:general transcription factor IIH subunit 2 Ssl1 isoform X2 [Calliopsis andreniformis]|uniref:general transcription factor IIH subunit 2 Ssl1 isoform X2 n=1 Tax=Calliopsis andreniformis TaxID=337506 RepID=UPI003FCCE632
MADEEEEKEYRWETGYEKTWEAIKEDDHGLLEASVADIIHNAKRKRQLEKKVGARLGMMRHLYIILDASESMSNQDLKPTRFLCSLKLLEDFIEEFFYQNPISQLGVIVTRNKRAEKISELAGNSKKHVKEIQAMQQIQPAGEPSLQNSLELALKSLRLLPSHASKEILIVIGALTTCDPGDINETIQSMKADCIRCSVIGLAAELYICKRMATASGGEHGVALDDKHFKEQLNMHIDPPPAATRLDAALVKMGFPHHALQSSTTDTSMAVCMWFIFVANVIKHFVWTVRYSYMNLYIRVQAVQQIQIHIKNRRIGLNLLNVCRINLIILVFLRTSIDEQFLYNSVSLQSIPNISSWRG